MNRSVFVVLCSVTVSLTAAPQSAAPAFEVTSIKPNNALDRSGTISGPSGSQFRVTNISLRMIVTYAYNVRDLELVDVPSWASAEKFDITATYPANAAHTLDETRAMVQRVLAERFGLRVRRETRDMPIYRLVRARDDGRLGPSLNASDVDCVQWLAEKKPQIIGTPPVGPGGARPACMFVTQRNYIAAGTRPIGDLARGLEGIVGRRVVDATGLTGNFDISLQWTPTPGLDLQPAASTGSAEPVSLFAALQEQLGLKVEAARGPVDVLVVDAVERPTPD